MSRVLNTNTNRSTIRAMGWITLALLAPGMATSATALGTAGDARPPTAPAAVRGAPHCEAAGPHLWRERFLCYRAAANLANERHTMPRAWAAGDEVAHTSTRSPQYGPTQERVRAEREERIGHVRIADAAGGIDFAAETGVGRSGSATLQ
jgi:hypothetical protein